MPAHSSLQGKVALVTGASRGIGKAIAERFSREGVRLALCARGEEDLRRTADELRSQSRADVLAVKANMTRLNDIRRFVRAAVKKFGRIDILVNNAGGANIGGIRDTGDDAWEYHLQLKLLGYVRVAREVLPHMTSGGGASIINIAGMAGKEPRPRRMLSGVTDAAILSFTKSLSGELAPERITVNAVNPGETDTQLAEESLRSLAAQLGKPADELRAEAGRGRLAAPEDVAAAVAFLASDDARFISGTSVNVDAGTSLGLW